ncbi:MAG: oligosaccharide flippase family protein [Butyrivibrio sp.]|nr:oligosaccharide flippase family protein [Butyrivibrio sp.]
MGKSASDSLLKRIKNAPETVKATLVFGIASFATSGLRYVLTPVFTRLLTTSEYGIVGIYNSWYSIIQVVLSITLIYPGILNVGLYEHKDSRWNYLSNMLGLITTVSLGSIIIYSLFHVFVNSVIGIPGSLVVLMLITCTFQPAMNLWTAKQRYEYKYKSTFLVTVGSAIIAQIISVAVVLYKMGSGDNLASVRLWSAGTVNIITAFCIYILIFTRGKQFYNKSLWKETILVAIPLIPHYLSYVVLNSTDKIMIGQMIGIDKAGIYNLTAVLSSIGVLFWRALLTTFSPFVNTKLGERKYDEIRAVIKPLWFFTGGFCVLGAVLSPEIVRVFGSKEYLEGIYVVPPIVAGIFTYAMYDAFASVSFFHKKSFNIMIASVTAAISNIIMNYFGILKFGYVAAGYTTLFSHLILIAMHYRNIRAIEKEKIYDGKVAMLYLAVITLACFSCVFLYPLFPLYRYILAFCILVMLASKYKLLINAIASMKV